MNTEKRHVDFKELKLGYRLPEIVQEIDQPLIDKAAIAHLDFNPVHTGIDWCERAMVFGTPKTVAHGMFTMSQLASVVLRHWLGTNVRIADIEVKLTRPVTVGSVITSRAEIKELHPRHDGDDLVVLGVSSTNAEGEVMSAGSVTVRVAK